MRLRKARDFAAADAIRDRLREGGWEVVDSAAGSELRELAPAARAPEVTMLTLAHGWRADLERWLDGVLRHTDGHDFEALVVDNSGDPTIGGWLSALREDRVRTLRLEPPLGWAEAANAGLDAATGAVVVVFDPGVELTGDVAGPLLQALEDPTVVAAGLSGARSEDKVGHFHAHTGPEVEALEGYVLAVRREQALAAGGFDRRYRFYRMADFELTYRLRDSVGGRAVVVPGLPATKHEHRLWDALNEDERARLSKRNFYRFLDRWGERDDMITR